jgi:hypothetical protein
MANICLKPRQGVVNSPGVLEEAMKIWQFAILVLISACVIWSASWFYEGVSHEAEFVVKHQQM